MKFRGLSVLAAAVLICAGCGMPAAGSASPRNRDVITSEQMIAATASTVYDAVRKLRPEWLSSRGPATMTSGEPDVPSVYLGGNNIGNVEALRRLRPDDVKEVVYFDASRASARFGMGHSRGVIEVILKAGA